MAECSIHCIDLLWGFSCFSEIIEANRLYTTVAMRAYDQRVREIDELLDCDVNVSILYTLQCAIHSL